MQERVCPQCGKSARGESACGPGLDALSEHPRASECAAGGIAVLAAEHAPEAEAGAGAPESVLVRWIALVFDTVDRHLVAAPLASLNRAMSVDSPEEQAALRAAGQVVAQ